jgi:hypothetical protein
MPDLDPQKAAELESIIDKMVDRGESDDDIKFIVDEYKAKHLSSPKSDAPSKTGGESGAFVRPITPSPLTPTSASAGLKSASWTETVNPLAGTGAVTKPVVKPKAEFIKQATTKTPSSDLLKVRVNELSDMYKSAIGKAETFKNQVNQFDADLAKKKAAVDLNPSNKQLVDDFNFSIQRRNEVASAAQKEIVRSEQIQKRIAETEKNIDNSLGNWESMSNSLSNVVTQIKAFIPKTELSISTFQNKLGEGFLKAYAMMNGMGNVDVSNVVQAISESGAIPQMLDSKKTQQSAFERLDELEKESKPTKSIIETAKQKDIGGLAAAIFDGGTSVLGTFVTGAPTGGVGIYTEMMGDAIYNYNKEKAKSLGISVNELYNQNKDEVAVPATIGAIAAKMEDIGLKGISEAINKNIAKKGVKEIAEFLLEGGKESGTEWVQTGLEEYNTALGKGMSAIDAGKIAWDTMTSEKGLEAALKGAAGSGVSIATGKAAKTLWSGLSSKRKNELKADLNKVQTLVAEKENPDLDENVVSIIDREINNTTANLQQAALQDVKERFNLTEENSNLVSKIEFEQSAIDDEIESKQSLVDNPALSPEAKSLLQTEITMLEAKKNELSFQVDEVIKNNAPVTLQKNTSRTPEKYGTINRNDGKGIIDLTKEEFEAEQANMQPKAEGTAPVEKPTDEQIAKDIKDRNFATFTYESESEVPEMLKDRISSTTTTDGKTTIRVTLPKSEADYLLSQQATPEALAGETIKPKTNEKANEDGDQKRGKDGEEDVTESLQNEGEDGGQKVDVQEGQVLGTEGAAEAAPKVEAGSAVEVDIAKESEAVDKTPPALRDVESTAKALEDELNKNPKIAEQLLNAKNVDKFNQLTDPQKKHLERINKMSANEVVDKLNELRFTPDNLPLQYELSRHNFDLSVDENGEWVSTKTERKEGDLDFDELMDRWYLTITPISESYHKAKADGTNPELVKAVESLLSKEETPKPTTNEKSSQKTNQEGSTEGSVLEGLRDGGTQDEGGQESTELRTEEEEVAPTQAGEVKGNGKVGGYNPKFKSAKKIQGEETTIEMPDGETREAEYIVVESDDILASHNEVAFSDTEGFPKTADGRNANSRNYKGDNSAQLKVNDDARNLKSSIVISDTATTDGGVPIISTDGIVISGNGRTMAIKLSQKIAPEKYAAYKADLLKRAVKFGIDPKEIANMKNPVLVKIDKNVKDYSVKTFDDYNGKYQKEESPTDKAIKRSSIIKADKALKGKILDIVGRHETMSDLFENRQDRKELFNLLVTNNIILKQETPKYLTDKGEFTPEGKDIVNDILIATILNPKTLEATNSVKAFRNKIINSLPVLSANYKLGDNSLEQNINDAVLLQSKIASMGSQEEFWTHLGQIGMFDVVDPDVVVINRMINNGADKFKKFIVAYNKSMEIDEESNLFGGEEVLTKQQVIDNLKKSNLNENERKVIANLEELYAANEQKRPSGNVEVVGGDEAKQETPKAEQPKPAKPTEKLTNPKNASDVAKIYRNKFGFTPQQSVWAARLFDAKAAFMSKILGISKEDYYSQYWFGVNEGEGGLSQLIEQSKENNISLGVKGKGFLNAEQIKSLTDEIESNYADDVGELLRREKDDIRSKLFNYDEPIASKTINGVDLRIAEGLTRDKKKTYLLYADGGIIGEFDSVADAKAAVKFVEDRLVKNKQLFQDRKGSWTKDAAKMKRIINMYEKADSTTAVHEMLGHDYLDRIIEASATNKESEADLRTIAEEYIKDTKSKEKVEDIIKTLKDFDVENYKTDKGTSVHEWFATQAEQYFATERDVKRETPQQSKMAKIFEAFRAHLAELYDIMNKTLIAPSEPMKKVFRKVFGEENFNKAEEIREENVEAINNLNSAALESNKKAGGLKSLADKLKEKGLGQSEFAQDIWDAASELIADKKAKRYNVTNMLKEMFPAIENDIEEMRKVLQTIGTKGELRQGAENILANPTISDEVKEKVAKMSEYTPESLKQVGLSTNEVIDYYIGEYGEVAGLEKIKSLLDKGEFDGYTEKVAIQQSLIGMYNKLAKFGATEQIRKEALNNAVDVAEQYINQGTSFGRAINAYKLLGSLTTEGRLVWAKRQTNKYVKPAHEALKESIRDLKADLKDAYKQVDYFFEQTLGREETEGQYKELIAQYQAEIDALKARKPREPKPSKTAYKGVKANREFKESDLANFAKDILAGGLFQDMETMTAPQKLAYGIMEKKPTNISEFAKAFGRYLGKKIDPKELEELYVQTRDLLITKDLAFADGLSTNEQLRADLEGLEVANKVKIEELERKKAEAEAKIAAKAKKGEKKEHSEELADFVIKDAKKAINGSIAKQKTYLDEILKALKEKTADVINKGKKDKIQTAKVSEVEAIKFALDAINNGGADANMWNNAVEQVKAKIKGDNTLSQADKDDLNLYLNDYTSFLYDNLLSENKIFKVIREKLIQSGYGNGTLVNWKQIIEGANGDIDVMRESIQKLVKNQLKDYDSVQVEKVLDAIVYKYDQEINKQRKKIADKYIEKELSDKKSTKKKTAAVQGKIGKILVENRLGILKDGNEDILNELAVAKGLQMMSAADWKTARQLAENIENSADGILKNRAIEEMTAFIASKQPLSFMNTLSAARFAGLLGRVTTVAVNLISNTIEGGLLAGGRAIRGNTSFIKESFKGVSKGGFKDILFGGGINQASKTSVEVNSSGMPYFRALEYYEGKGKKFIKSGKYVGRVLDATDSVFQEMFASGYDKVYLEKQIKLENPNATTAEIDQMVSDALSKTKYDAFYAQALQEVIKSGQKPTPANVKRRTYEILRESQVSQMAINLSDLESREKTFKSEFKENRGVATLFGSMLASSSNVSRKVVEPVAEYMFKLSGYNPKQAAELAKKIGDVIPNKIMPFTRGVSNVIERALEKDIVYGLTKSLVVKLGVNKMPTTTMEEKMAKVRAEEKVKDLATTAIFTNILIYGVGSLLYAASKAWDDDEEKEGRNPEKTGVYPIQSQKTSIGSTSSAKERATPENTLVLFGQKIPLKWLGSIGAELSLTANINKALTKDSKSSGAEKVANAALDITESYMQQSFMMAQNDKQSVVSLLRNENVNWDKVEDYMVNDMISYGGSYVLWSGFVNQSLQGARYLSGDKSYQEAKTLSEKVQKQMGLAGLTYDNKKPNYMGRPLEATEVNREGIQGFLGMFSKSYKSPTESWVENVGYKESLVGRNSKQLARIESESFVPPSNEQYDDFTDNTRKLIGKGIEFAYDKRNEVVVPLNKEKELEINKKTGKAYTTDEYTNKLLNDMSNAIEGYKRTELVNRLDVSKYDRDEYLSKLDDYYYKLEDAMKEFYIKGSIRTKEDREVFSDKVNSILPPPPKE